MTKDSLKDNLFEGTIVQKKGEEACKGMKVTAIRIIDTSDFKETIKIMGEKGFLGYPSEELYVELSEKYEQGYLIKGEITEVKKEGICNALFCAYKY